MPKLCPFCGKPPNRTSLSKLEGFSHGAYNIKLPENTVIYVCSCGPGRYNVLFTDKKILFYNPSMSFDPEHGILIPMRDI